MSAPVRLPDFVIIGAMKSGTTSLHSWLAEHPSCWLPAMKEPNFFSDEWNRGLAWYGELFAKAPSDKLTGEASVRYTSPSLAPVAASRMASTIPGARLIYVIRHPLERVRSQYRHMLSHRWTDQPITEVLSHRGTELTGRSLYFTCLRPYIEAFPKRQICVVRFEDLVTAPRPGWVKVLAHLGLDDCPPPETRRNVSAEIPQYPRWFVWLRKRGTIRKLRSWPRPARAFGRRLLSMTLPGRQAQSEDLQRRSEGPIPPEIERRIWDDIERLESWLGVDEPLWAR